MEIRPYSNQDQPLLDVFEILPEDRKFTRTPIHNIDLAKGDDERHPTLVMRDNQCVGFFTLHEGQGVKPYSDNNKAIFFRSFSVDARYRGQGLGKAVIQQLPSYIKSTFPYINEIILTVNTDNDKAIGLYKQAQYSITGDAILEGRPVYVMNFKI
ncbi:N-acetyltransferase [Staphylococcus haemolyticus]|uniref:GNAT family N-acetyltransferase n=1 Tax=Staphylococcus TaxID=1279 RepID=UPI00069FEF84|nr:MULTISPECIES: N-acetyltransferase [Staphylococcus]SIK22747.1 Predicted acetyltransferase [Mycobacteroides abscessus subsp. abscessus]KAA2275099.1 GNAT family N-acetyltransferase [Staphylococcus sp. GDX7P312P]KAA2279892.1 GNAT family N-acetyltransferase [Staphylococcus sp. GDX7P459A]MCE4954628.1 GNAT family N-acetyltransferase [Staphylococcus haemolyticus]MDT0705819.1 N-acetyltransferase [Staphylococcus haemolyticus]